MTSALSKTLTMIAGAAAHANDRWWIIGSAALVVHGRSLPEVKDVDLLMSAYDAEDLLKRVGEVPRRGDPSDRFRSLVFGTWREPPIPVEIMGGFSLATRHGWQEVAPATREEVTVARARVFVPSADELVTLLRSFGRQKDLDRAKILRT